MSVVAFFKQFKNTVASSCHERRRLYYWSAVITMCCLLGAAITPGFASVVSPDTYPAVAYQRGVTLHQQGSYHQAIDWLRYSAQKNPRSSNSWYYLADSYLKTHQLKSAQASYQHILSYFPYSQAAQLSRRGLSLIALGTPSIAAQEAVTRALHPIGIASNAANDGQGDVPLNLSYGKDDYYDLIRSGGRYMRWSPQDFPLRVYIQKAPKGIRYFEPGYTAAVHKAFKPWQQAFGGRSVFIATANPDNAQVILKWVNGIGGGKEQLVSNGQGGVGVVYTAGLTSPSVGPAGLERMNVQITTSSLKGEPQPVNAIQSVVTHELGHALGLLGHSDAQGDIMYAQAKHFTLTLSKRDSNTIRHLYALPAQVTSRGEGTSKEWAQLLKDIEHQEEVVKKRPTALEYQALANSYFMRAAMMQSGKGERAVKGADGTIDPKKTPLYWKNKAMNVLQKLLPETRRIPVCI